MTVESTGSGLGLKKSVLDSAYKTEYDENIDLLDEVVNRVGKNLLINGNPLVNQRDYVSGTATSGANEYALDRWRVVTSGQALTFSASENVVTLTLPVGGIEQVIEGLSIQSGTHVVSFTKTGDTVCKVDGVTRTNGQIVTLTGGTDATIKFSSAAGTGTVKLIQIEKGSVVTDFGHRPYAQELALCHRYFERQNYDSADIVCQGARYSSTGFEGTHYYQPKRVQPAITASAQTDFSQRIAGSTDAFTAVGFYIPNKEPFDRAEFAGTVSAGTTGDGGHVRSNTNGAYVDIDSEL